MVTQVNNVKTTGNNIETTGNNIDVEDEDLSKRPSVIELAEKKLCISDTLHTHFKNKSNQQNEGNNNQESDHQINGTKAKDSIPIHINKSKNSNNNKKNNNSNRNIQHNNNHNSSKSSISKSNKSNGSRHMSRPSVRFSAELFQTCTEEELESMVKLRCSESSLRFSNSEDGIRRRSTLTKKSVLKKRSSNVSRSGSQRRGDSGFVNYNYEGAPKKVTEFVQDVIAALNTTNIYGANPLREVLLFAKYSYSYLNGIVVQCNNPKILKKVIVKKTILEESDADLILSFTGDQQLIQSYSPNYQRTVAKSHKVIYMDWRDLLIETRSDCVGDLFSSLLIKIFGSSCAPNCDQELADELNRPHLKNIQSSINHKFNSLRAKNRRRGKKGTNKQFLDFDGNLYPIVLWDKRGECWIYLITIIPFFDKDHGYFLSLYKKYKKFSVQRYNTLQNFFSTN